MKTVDLIPFILLELNDQDKYGFELTKSIETKSNGRIVIKQPTLYNILKKLEKSKFISSYWQDSEIGGKRHYYKLTELGKLHVSTLPTIEELLQNAFNDENEIPYATNILKNDEDIITPKETIISSETVFAEEISINPIDTATESEININNLEILKPQEIKDEEKFATNDSVAKFTEKNISLPKVENISEDTSLNNLMPELDEKPTNIPTYQSIKYVDYLNIKKDANFIKATKIAKKMMLKSILVCLSILAILTAFNLIVSYTGTSAIYYAIWILSLICAIFNPIICASKLEKIKENLHKKDYNLNNKKSLLINFGIILAVTILVLVVNIAMGITTINTMFAISNFENFYAPIILSCCGLLDCIYYKILIKHII